MSYMITARFADGRIEKHPATGRLVTLLNAEYDRGAVGVTAIACRPLPAPQAGPSLH